ncbi:MAG: hypothetical protein ACTSSP_06640 [Candidatus Asgardarchaeia archaeon]
MTNAQLSIILKLKDEATKKYRTFSQQMEKGTYKLVQNLKKYWMAYAAAIAAAILVLKKLARTSIDMAKELIKVGSTVEDLKVRLEVLLGSVEEGNKVFKEMSELAGKVPKTYEEIMKAATDLAGVVRGGSEEIKKLMPIIVDISAGTGIAVRDVTSQMIRMYSAGAAAADMFRERGVLAALGFQAGVSYTAKQTIDTIVKAWEDGTAKYVGASKGLAETWTGMCSMMSDAWFNFKREVGEKFFEDIKEDLQAILFVIEESKKPGGEYAKVIKEIRDNLKDVYGNLKEFLDMAIVSGGKVIDIWRDLRVGVLRYAIAVNKAAKAFMAIQKAQAILTGMYFVPAVKQNFEEITKTLNYNIEVWSEALDGAQKAAAISAEQKGRDFINRREKLMKAAREKSRNIKFMKEMGIESEPFKDLDLSVKNVVEKIRQYREELTDNEKRYIEETKTIKSEELPFVVWLNDQLAEVSIEGLKKELEIKKEGLKEFEQASLESTQKELENYKKMLKAMDEAYKKYQDKRIEIREQLRDRIFELTHTEKEYAIKKLGEELEERRKLLSDSYEDRKLLAKWYLEEYQKIIKGQQEILWWQEEAARRTYNSMADSFKTFFVDALQGYLRTAQDYFLAFRDAIINALADIMAQMVAIKMLKGIFPQSWIPSQMLHQGGAVMHRGEVVYAHQGLAVDEIPIIAQRGEGFLSRRGMANIGGPAELNRINRGEVPGPGGGPTIHNHYYISAIDAKSFKEYLEENKGSLESAIQSAMDENYNLRRM